MIRLHPFRVLGATFVLAVALLALSYPGRNDTSGAWYYLSAVGWFGFMISVLVLVVLAITAIVIKARARGRRALGS